jgi:hypothetical protein
VGRAESKQPDALQQVRLADVVVTVQDVEPAEIGELQWRTEVLVTLDSEPL